MGSSDVIAPDVYAASHVSVETLGSVKRAAGDDHNITFTLVKQLRWKKPIRHVYCICEADAEHSERTTANVENNVDTCSSFVFFFFLENK